VTTDPENWEGATIPRNNVIAEDFAQHRWCLICSIHFLLEPANLITHKVMPSSW
jgi:hypothetical protein